MLFVAQLALNGAWLSIFFGAHEVRATLGVIIAPWLLILITIFAFKKANSFASILMLPYLAWISLVAVRNDQIWQLNA